MGDLGNKKKKYNKRPVASDDYQAMAARPGFDDYDSLDHGFYAAPKPVKTTRRSTTRKPVKTTRRSTTRKPLMTTGRSTTRKSNQFWTAGGPQHSQPLLRPLDEPREDQTYSGLQLEKLQPLPLQLLLLLLQQRRRLHERRPRRQPGLHYRKKKKTGAKNSET